MRVLALDPSSTSTGFAVNDVLSDVPAYGTIVIPGTYPQEERLLSTMQSIQRLIATFHVERLAWEIPVRGNLIRALDDALRAYCRRKKLPFGRYYPSSVKKAVTGHGDADKDAVGRAIYLRYPQLGDGLNEHEYDAIAVLEVDLGNLRLADAISDPAERRFFLDSLMHKPHRRALQNPLQNTRLAP